VRLLLVSVLIGIFIIFSGASFASQWFVAEERAQHPDRVGTSAAHLLGPAGAKSVYEFQGQDTSTGSKSAPEQPDISRSGSEFLEVCSSVGSEGNKDSARIGRDATCLGWVEGIADGFLVYGELLSVPRKDRVACMPRGVSTLQIVRVIKKYLADNPGKAHRPTRYIASIALAGAFPCKTGK
jgi:hypothetical protein